MLASSTTWRCAPPNSRLLMSSSTRRGGVVAGGGVLTVANDVRNRAGRHQGQALECDIVRPPLLDLFAAYRAGRTDFPLAALAPPRLLWASESRLGALAAPCLS